MPGGITSIIFFGKKKPTKQPKVAQRKNITLTRRNIK
jgi:hypothetical protein|tara:strand:+ start:349 stop:459 length:111 start_codon:yes stop_codon:yes gene_type:complete